MKRQLPPEQTAAQVKAESVALIDGRKDKLTNAQVLMLLQATYRQRRLDRIMDPESLHELRVTLQVYTRYLIARDSHVAIVREILTRAEQPDDAIAAD
jgi:hypothetical protein